MAKNNLIFVTAATEIGGAENSLISLIKGLEKNDFETTVLPHCKGPFSNRLKEKGIKHYLIEGTN